MPQKRTKLKYCFSVLMVLLFFLIGFRSLPPHVILNKEENQKNDFAAINTIHRKIEMLSGVGRIARPCGQCQGVLGEIGYRNKIITEATCTNDKKLRFVFSYLVATRRFCFNRLKKHSTFIRSL